AGILAAFNVYEKGGAVRGSWRGADVLGFEAERLAVYDWFARNCRIVAVDEERPLEVQADDAMLLVLVSAADGFTPLGLIDKYIAPAAIRTQVRMPGRTALVLATGGTFAYATELPHRVLVEGEEVEPAVDDGFFRVDCSDREGEVFVELVQK
ncbi:MAG: hypothetical protein QGH25_12020, partial [Candidatus Latescibacteria bacterium]|nr:hypothetical protein [Candidatus Latescibacterota bacterium]